jgi:hypothetical protein
VKILVIANLCYGCAVVSELTQDELLPEDALKSERACDTVGCTYVALYSFQIPLNFSRTHEQKAFVWGRYVK